MSRRMRLLLSALASVMLSAGLVACAGSSSATSSQPVPNTPLDEETAPFPADVDPSIVPDDTLWTGVGTVQYVNLEGGFYAIVDETLNRRLVPDSLPAPVRTDGLPVEYEARVQHDRVSIRMWGTPVTLLSLTAVE